MTEFASYRECLAGKDVLVLGTGPSIRDAPTGRHTIGVNFAARLFDGDVDFMVCCEPYSGSGIATWEAAAEPGVPVFTRTRPALSHFGNACLMPQGFLSEAGPTGSMSTWTAAAIALYMGAENVVLCGVDCLGHERFGTQSAIRTQNTQWLRLDEYARARGQRVTNLSVSSAIWTIQRCHEVRPR